MKHDMKKPCLECPYIGKTPGWIGGHDHPQEFVDLAAADAPFPCHQTVEWEECWYGVHHSGGWPCEKLGCDGEQHIVGEPQQCAGQLIFMTKLLKRSRDRDRFNMQTRLKTTAADVEPLAPKELVRVHMRRGKEFRDPGTVS